MRKNASASTAKAKKRPATTKKSVARKKPVAKKPAKRVVRKKEIARTRVHFAKKSGSLRGNVSLARAHHNPIIEPIESNTWESKATFNPAALLANGKIHLLYRAIGDNDVSVLGYAVSTDGYSFERFGSPAYVPRKSFEGGFQSNTYSASGDQYISGGGGWGGCEDPRLTEIDGRAYLLYVAFDGGNPPRVALSTIELESFLKKDWQWTEPVLISRPGIVNKNACLLPEKINGKYVIFHRVFPDILVDYVDDLNFDGETTWLEGHYKISPRRKFWDSRKIGIGAPPIKTSAGWLLIYQSVGDQDSGRYKMGAMILDLKRPEKVIARCREPILEPEAWYENEGWKYGVVYPCGAVIMDKQLIVYYGGADKVVCAASCPIDEFLDLLLHNETPRLQPVALTTKTKSKRR